MYFTILLLLDLLSDKTRDEKTCSCNNAKTKGADQLAHLDVVVCHFTTIFIPSHIFLYNSMCLLREEVPVLCRSLQLTDK